MDIMLIVIAEILSVLFVYVLIKRNKNNKPIQSYPNANLNKLTVGFKDGFIYEFELVNFDYWYNITTKKVVHNHDLKIYLYNNLIEKINTINENNSIKN